VVLLVGREGVVLLRRARNSAPGKGGRRDGEGEAGMERSTTDEAGGKGLEAEGAPASRDANDLFKTGGVDAGTGASAGTGVDAVMSGAAHGATISRCVVPSRAAGGMSCSAAATALGGDASVGRGLV
jgi:hypothetical protein